MKLQPVRNIEALHYAGCSGYFMLHLRQLAALKPSLEVVV